eukprot:jgi/Psemu1/284987/fgenesh1_pg.70_\
MDATTTSNRNGTPLLLLLDGILSQDELCTNAALSQIEQIDPSFRYHKCIPLSPNSKHSSADDSCIIRDSPLRSASALEAIVERLLAIQPHLAQVSSENDGSLPLHFAASIGNIRIASLLIRHYREAALAHNTKGKIPLHYAAREGRTEMQVLQTISDPDDVTSWESGILDLCLRGAVANFSDLSPEERGYIDDHGSRIIGRVHNNYGELADISTPTDGNGIAAEVINEPQQQHQIIDRESKDSMCRSTSETSLEVASISVVNDGTSTPPRLPPGLDISLPRSKSPILNTDECGKKRSSSNGSNSNKRQCRGSIDHDVRRCGCESSFDLEKQTFYQLHAALECSANTSVLKCVLDRYPEQHTLADDYGRLPLHIAISHCRSEGCVELILERIWKPNPSACFYRDGFERLPLHLALMTRADASLVKVLLEVNPSSGVERFARQLPIHMAAANRCDLSTIFMLVRGDPAVVQTWK